MNFAFNLEALIEYREAAEWLENRSIFAGTRFIQEIESGIQAILQNPGRWQPVGSGCQVFRPKRFPCKIYFLHEPELHHHLCRRHARPAKARCLANEARLKRNEAATQHVQTMTAYGEELTARELPFSCP